MEVRNQYQSAIFQEATEHPNPVLAHIQGTVPNWISGTFLKVGPGKYKWNDTSYNHWFEGVAIMFRFHVANGQVEFSSKFLESSSFLESKKKNRITRSTFATRALPDPCKNILSRYMSYYFAEDESDDNCNVAMVQIKDGILASADIPVFWKIDENTLESTSFAKIMDELPGLYRS